MVLNTSPHLVCINFRVFFLEITLIIKYTLLELYQLRVLILAIKLMKLIAKTTKFNTCNIVCVCVHCIVVTLMYLHLFTPVLLYLCMERPSRKGETGGGG